MSCYGENPGAFETPWYNIGVGKINLVSSRYYLFVSTMSFRTGFVPTMVVGHAISHDHHSEIPFPNEIIAA